MKFRRIRGIYNDWPLTCKGQDRCVQRSVFIREIIAQNGSSWGKKTKKKKQTTFAHLEYGKDIDSMEVAQCVLAVNVRTSGTKEWSPYLNVCHGNSDRITMDLRRWVCGKRGCRVENAPPPTRLRTRFWCLSRLQRVDRRVDQVQIGKLCSILESGVPDTFGLVPN